MNDDHAVVPLTIEAVDPRHEDALALLDEAAREARRLYADRIDPGAPWPTNSPAAPRSVYLVARLAGRTAGCAALRPFDSHTAEVRRIYVLPAFRRRGIARTLLVCLERHAAELGYTRLLLETGDRQLPAIALYEATGYRHASAFGPHMGDPTSVCFEKHIDR
ncbi:MAG TPA: GNAT family N-acetyltransferase [Burkholderiaceae bacterium]|nr:GNAT family N-acetyltransferase [Burkholderiaceae bacterium]